MVQPKEQGGLGVIDPMLKAKVMQGMWVIRTLAPGESPGSFGFKSGLVQPRRWLAGPGH